MSVCADEKAVMSEGWRFGSERFEEGELHAGVGHMIFAADDVGDGEVHVIDHARERIEGRAVFADEDWIGKRAEVHGLVAADEIVPGDDCRQRLEALFGARVRKAKAPVGLAALGFEVRAFGGREFQARAIINGRQVAGALTCALPVELVFRLVTGIEEAAAFRSSAASL